MSNSTSDFVVEFNESTSAALYFVYAAIHGDDCGPVLHTLVEGARKELRDNRAVRSAHLKLKPSQRKRYETAIGLVEHLMVFLKRKVITGIRGESPRRELPFEEFLERVGQEPGDATVLHRRIHFTFSDNSSICVDFRLNPNKDEGVAYRNWCFDSVTWKEGGEEFKVGCDTADEPAD